jgi:tetratricopeptide (TPR) repeat protein
MSRNKDAESAFADALAVLAPLAHDYPDVTGYRVSLGKAYNNQGMLFFRAFDDAKAETAYGKALATHGELHQAYPQNLQFAVNYAGSCVNFGDFLRTNGKLESAIERYTQAVEAFEDARKREPNHGNIRSALFGAYWGRAMAWVQADDLDQANADWRRAVELSEGHADITSRTYRPLPLAYLGDHMRANQEAEVILAETKVETEVLFDYACAYSLCSAAVWKDAGLPTEDREQLSERYALRAMEMLVRTRAAGRYKDPIRIERLKSHSALKPLQPRADFQKFVAELNASAKPAKVDSE